MKPSASQSQGTSVTDSLEQVTFRTAKAGLRKGERLKGAVQSLNPDAGTVLEEARKRAGYEPKQMAAEMGCSHSLTLRALKSADDLGWHRLWKLSDAFWLEVLFLIAQRRGIARVRRQIEEIHDATQ